MMCWVCITVFVKMMSSVAQTELKRALMWLMQVKTFNTKPINHTGIKRL